MSKVLKCAECGEEIVWNEYILRTEDGEVYHDSCVTTYPIGYSIHSLDGDYLATSDDTEETAFIILSPGEYIDD